jgi:hypothetical protein
MGLPSAEHRRQQRSDHLSIRHLAQTRWIWRQSEDMMDV